MEVKASESFLTEALTNGTFSIEDTENALRRSLDHSFSYLYRLQRNMIQYEEYHYTTRNVVDQPDLGDMWLDKKYRICINLPGSLVPEYNREKYKRSDYFQKEIPFISEGSITNNGLEFISNKTLFTRMPVILIDNKVLKNFFLIVYDSYFTVILPFTKKFLYHYDSEKKKYHWNTEVPNENGTFGNNEYEDHTIDLQIINHADVFDYSTNSPMLQLQSYDGGSFDRIKTSSMTNLPSIREDGCYFAVIYDQDEENEEYLGTTLQDVDLVEEEFLGQKVTNFIVNWDNNTIDRLKQERTGFKIRFFFYRYLRKHKSYHGNDILVRTLSEQAGDRSEFFLIQKEEYDTYEMPIPIENLMLMKIDKDDYKTETDHNNWHLFDQSNCKINYSSIYYVDENVVSGDKLRAYFFYQPGYELSYIYAYRFFYRYLYHKWGKKYNLPLESLVNKIYFGDLDLSDEFDESMLEVTSYRYSELLFKDGKIKKDQISQITSFILSNISKISNPSTYDWANDLILKNANLYISQPLPIVIENFMKVFKGIIEAPIVEYRYDDIDYMKGMYDDEKTYKEALSPFEYKVRKLKEFIKDDLKCFHEYLLQQDKTSIKYDFIVDSESMKNKVRTVSEVNRYTFEEPMYVFTFEKKNSSESVGCRFFIDGFFFGNFTHENNGFVDFIYIPVSKMPDGSLVEVEYFPTYLHETDITFENTDDVKEIIFTKDDDICPTISDLVISDKDNIYQVYPHSDFQFDLVDDRYNYFENGNQISAYQVQDMYTLTGSNWYDNATGDTYYGVAKTFMGYKDTMNTDTVISRLMTHWEEFLKENSEELYDAFFAVIQNIDAGTIDIHEAQDEILNVLDKILVLTTNMQSLERTNLAKDDVIFYSDCENIKNKSLTSYWALDDDNLIDLENIGKVKVGYCHYDGNGEKISDTRLFYEEVEAKRKAGSLELKPIVIERYAHSLENDTIEYVKSSDIPSTASNSRVSVIKTKGTVKRVQYGDYYYRTDGYYDHQGKYFSPYGQPDSDSDLPKEILTVLRDSGILAPVTIYQTNNEFTIEEDTNYIDYTQVADYQKSILDPDNKGMNSTRLYKLRIRLKNQDLLRKELTVHLNKHSIYNYLTMEYSNYPCCDMNIINPEKGDEYIRVFKEGRLMSKNRYAFLTNLNNPRIQLLERIKRGTSVCIDGTPYRNRLVYFMPEIETNDSGEIYIDLREYINKPFDLRYYEIYLNGRRLNRTNVFPISQWEIRLAGVHSIYNLEIYEKDRDWEYYGCDFGNYYTVSDLFEENFMEEEVKDKIIEEMFGELPKNDNTEDHQPWDRDFDIDTVWFEVFYYNRLIPLGLASGDEVQFNIDDIRENFKIIYDNFYRKNALGENVLLLNPDVYYAGQDSDRWITYMTGNDDTFVENGCVSDD